MATGKTVLKTSTMGQLHEFQECHNVLMVKILGPLPLTPILNMWKLQKGLQVSKK
jgi:hypothetical protein